MKLSAIQKGIVLSFIAAFMGVLSNTTIKFIGNDFSALNQTLIRSIIATITVLIIFRSKINFIDIRKSNWRYLILLILIGVFSSAGALYFLTLANIKTSLGNVAIVKSPQPLFVFLLALPILKEKFDIKMLAYLLISVYGVLIISTNSFIPTISGWGEGELYALLCTLLFAAGFVGRKLLTGSKFNSVEISFWTLLISSITLTGISIFDGSITKIGAIDSTVGLNLLLGGTLVALITYLNNESLRFITVTLASQLRLIEIVFSVIIGIFLFSEMPNIYSIIGGSLIVFSVYLATLQHK